jgi:Phage terminase large subunit gpA, ATPase domain/Terminase large subunit gpA, endonuclease domain
MPKTLNMQQVLMRQISAGLKRKSIQACSTWSREYRVMGKPFPGPWATKFHPWADDMMDCDSEMMIGQKGAQLCFTEVALNKSFFYIDVRGETVLYVLPTDSDASDFSSGRFDPALELSEHLKDMFSDVKNIGHKRAGTASLYVRGSRSRSKLKSIPAAIAMVDELEEMKQENIPLIWERMSGQPVTQSFLLSTPTVPDMGINEYFKMSTEEHWFFKCPSCSKHTELLFPECLVITAESWSDPSIYDTHLICKECKNLLPHEAKFEFLAKANGGQWIPSFKNRVARGFHVSQLYSSTVKPYELAQSFLKGKENPADEQEFWNSKLGLPHEAKGAKVTDSDIKNCMGGYTMLPYGPSNGLITMGVDVGSVNHVVIDQWFPRPGVPSHYDVNMRYVPKRLKIITVESFKELVELFHDFNVNCGVIDAQPETRKSKELCQKLMGFFWRCYYARGMTSREIVKDDDDYKVNVHRASWLDMSLRRHINGTVALPRDTPEEYKENVKALVRVLNKDADGNPVARYVKGTKPDHYAHAGNYSEIALRLSSGAGGCHDIEDVY